MAPEKRQIVFINAAHSFTHYCLLILPTAVLAMARARRRVRRRTTGRSWRWRPAMFVLYGLFALPQGWLAERFGRQGADGRVLPRHRRVDGARPASPTRR